MKKILFFAAVMGVAFTSCMNEEFIGDNSPTTSQGTPGAIGFNLNIPAVTRLDKSGEDAASDLGNRFIVYGEKGDITNAAPTEGNLVFPNYQVNYATNTAYTTTSNTKNWEYVGYTHSDNYQSNITMDPTSAASDEINASNAAQTIKYWDYGAANYIFTAVSAADGDIENGRVKIQKNQYGTTAYDKGYTITLKKTGSSEPYTYPDLSKLFFADREVIVRSAGSDRNATNAYGGNVTFKFRNLLSHVRVGMFETIPGYSVKIDKFHYRNDGTPATFAAMKEAGHTSNSTTAFVANASNLGTSNEATLTVTYQSSGTTVNQPTVAVSDATAATSLTLGTNIPGTALGETATAARFDQATANTYTPFFPQETNSVPLKLMVDYTLTAPVTNEVIHVYGATAEIPAAYLQWKPNYKYTYLFKITDNTDGKTKLPDGVSPDSPEGLYPITFDAVEVVAEDGLAEYITTVSEPTITTFGVNSATGKYVTGGSEYAAGSDIYATILEGSTVKTPVLTGSDPAPNVRIFNVTYKVGTTDAEKEAFPITEASVAEALANPGIIHNAVYTCVVSNATLVDVLALSSSTTYYKADENGVVPGAAGYVVTPATIDIDYTIDSTPENNTIINAVYTCDVAYTSVSDATTLAAGTTYYKTDGTKAPGETGYVPTVAVEGSTKDYEVAPKIKAVDITTYNTDDTYFTGNEKPAVVAEVPAEDGTTKTIDALKLTGVKAGTYAIEYEASAAWTGDYKKVYKVIVVQ